MARGNGVRNHVCWIFTYPQIDVSNCNRYKVGFGGPWANAVYQTNFKKPRASKMYVLSSCSESQSQFTYCGKDVTCKASLANMTLDRTTGNWKPNKQYCDLPVCERKALRAVGSAPNALAGSAMIGQTESRTCNTNICVVDCKMSAWSAWSTCTAACRFQKAYPTQFRTRHVLFEPQGGGKECPTNVNQTQYCNKDNCPDVTVPEIWIPSMKPSVGSPAVAHNISTLKFEFLSTTVGNTPNFTNAEEKIAVYSGNVEIRKFSDNSVAKTIPASKISVDPTY